MACFWNLYKEYCQKVGNRKWIVEVTVSKKKATIRVITNSKDFDINEQFKFLNFLSLKRNIKKYGLNNFYITKIKSITPNCDSIYCFVSDKNKYFL